MLAFELADRYRNPVIVMADGFIGQMMEPVHFPIPVQNLPEKSWAVRGNAETLGNLISSIYLAPEDLEAHVQHLYQKFAAIAALETRFEEYRLADAQLVIVGYGIVSRLLRTAVDMARAQGVPAGLLRPITLWPFPTSRLLEIAQSAAVFLVCELSTGQMIEDVRLAVNGAAPVQFYGRSGGMVPSAEELLEQILRRWQELPAGARAGRPRTNGKAVPSFGMHELEH